MSWTLDGRPLRSVLVARLRYLGDIVMSTVVPAALRRGDPELEIGFLCERSGAPLLAGHPDVDRVHILSSRRSGSDAEARRGVDDAAAAIGHGAWGTIRDLRRRRYDLAVDLFFNPRSAWLLRLGGAARRIGGPRGSRRRLYTHAVAAPTIEAAPAFRNAAPGGLGEHLGRLAPLVHAPSGLGFVDWYAATCPEGLAPHLPHTDLTTPARAALAGLGLTDERPGTLLIPGATWPSKAWPRASWGRLAAALAPEGRGPVVAVAPPGVEPESVAALADARLSPGGWLPPLPLSDVLSILAASRRVVTVDGGLMHAAVALGRPTVALFGPTDHDLWFPYGRYGPFRVLGPRPDCHPCDLHDCDAHVCLPELHPDTVMDALADLDGDAEVQA